MSHLPWRWHVCHRPTIPQRVRCCQVNHYLVNHLFQQVCIDATLSGQTRSWGAWINLVLVFSCTLCQISLKLGGCLSYAKIALEPRPHVPENSGPWEILICVCFLCGPVGPQNTTFWAENRFFRHEILWLSKICCHLGEPPFDCGSSHVKIFHQLPRDRALGQF